MENFHISQDTSNKSFIQIITGFLEKKPVIYQFLRFVCIGLLNTGLNFLVTNSISKALGISQGWKYGMITGVGFICAVIQSYLWNRTWTFGSETGVTLRKNLGRLFWVGFLGGLSILLILVASKFFAPTIFYLILLVVYLIFESVLWKRFGFHLSSWNHESHSFLIFFMVTGVGFLINSTLSAVLSTHIHISRTDLDKNIALALATGVTLFWNFTGYKLLVFKK